MRDAGVQVLRPLGDVAEPFVEAERLDLRVQLHRGRAALAAGLLHGAHQGGAQARAPGLLEDREPAEQDPALDAAGDGERLLPVDQPGGAERGAVGAEREQVLGGGVEVVPLLVLGDLLLDDEDLAPDSVHQRHVGLARGDPDVGHVRTPRR